MLYKEIGIKEVLSKEDGSHKDIKEVGIMVDLEKGFINHRMVQNIWEIGKMMKKMEKGNYNITMETFTKDSFKMV